MSKRITVPSTIQEAIASLNGLEALMRAKQWERAAIVWAFTQPHQGQRTSDEFIGSLTIAAFARLGISGLRHEQQVRAYRAAWQSAIDDGQAVDVKPGDDVVLPKVPWKDHFGEATPDVQDRVAKAVLRDPERARRLVRSELGIRENVTQALDELTTERINPGYQARHVEPEPAPAVDEYRLRRAAMLVLDALDKEVKGEWRASGPWWGQVLAFIQEWAGRRSDQEALPSVHESIADFLAAAREA